MPSNFTDNISHDYTNLKSYYQNSLFLNIFFLRFPVLAPGYLETSVNCDTNCKTPKIVLVQVSPFEMKVDKVFFKIIRRKM